MSEKILFSVGDFSVYDNRIYRLKPKKDFSVPEEMQRKGYNKYPGSPHFACLTANDNVYDTGFEKTDKQYVRYEPHKKEEVVKQRRDSVLIPYLQTLGLSEDRYKSSSVDDWDDFKVRLEETKTFNTADVKERMELYVCLVGKSIVPPETDDFDPMYDGACFKLLDSKVSRKRENEGVEMKMKATAKFYRLYESSPEVLVNILFYMGYSELYRGKADREVLIQYLDNRVLRNSASTEEFIELVELAETHEGKEELLLSRLIYLAYKVNHSDFGKSDGYLTYKTETLGRSEKETAKMLAKNVNYEELRVAILQDELLTIRNGGK